ncbi:MAG TPA: hypothetical protein VKA67_07260, partial [Verrucomicrobiae bacterium]|nr:hypothetical protein [Verrucomicrobiae bacterium]
MSCTSLFLFVAFAAVALSPDRRRLQYSCQTWTHKDKPSANGINQTSRSPGGYFWVNAGTHQSVSSINTKPGDYCFQVLARSEESAWSPVGVGFAVGLLPHYSQTTWFTVMAGGLMAAGLLGVYSRRVKQWARTQK